LGFYTGEIPFIVGREFPPVNSTPEEDFLGKKLDVAHSKIFGSSFYYHVTKDVRKKIEPTTKLGIFVGYTDTPQNCQVYLPSHRMTMVCRDVKFDDEKAMRCSVERELQLHAYEDLLSLKEEPHDDLE